MIVILQVFLLLGTLDKKTTSNIYLGQERHSCFAAGKKDCGHQRRTQINFCSKADDK